MNKAYQKHVKLHWDKAVSLDWFRIRLRKMSEEEAIAKPTRDYTKYKYWYVKKWYDSIPDPKPLYNTVLYRLLSWMEKEDAIKMKIKSKNPYKELWKKHKELLWNNSVTYQSFYQRIHVRKRSIEKAINTPLSK